MKKALSIPVALLLFLVSYYFFQKSINLPYYDRFIARHLASYHHLKELSERDPVDYVVMGDSTGLHLFQPTKLKVSAENICLSGASLIDTYYIFKKMDFRKIRKGIVLATSFYSESHYNSDLWTRFISTGFYSNDELIEIYNIGSKNNIYPASELSYLNYAYKIALSRLFLFPEAFTAMSNFLENSMETPKSIIFERYVKEHRGYIPRRHEHTLPRDLFYKSYVEFYSKPFIEDRTDGFYLEKILALAEANNLKVYFLSPVLASSALGINTSVFEDSFENHFLALEKRHSNFKYLKIESPGGIENFSDFNHLNDLGADLIADHLSKIMDVVDSSNIYYR